MAHTKVLLREDVDDLGARGEIVRVRAGYARNYLLPRNLAVEASAGNVKGIEQERAALLKKEAKERATAESQSQQMSSLVLEFKRKATPQRARWFARPFPAWAQVAAAAVVFGVGMLLGIATRAGAPPEMRAATATQQGSSAGVSGAALAELEGRLRTGPAVFRLMLQLAEAGDPTDDVTALWPETRSKVELGRLDVTGISPTSAEDERRLIFDPTNRTDGIELSADPILLARSAAYGISYERRRKGE